MALKFFFYSCALLLVAVSFFVQCNAQLYSLEEEFLRNVSFPDTYVKIVKERILQHSHVSPACKSHVNHYIKALLRLEPWALKMFDAASKIPSGILKGRVGDFGNFDECMEIETSIDGQDVYGKYCVVNFLDFYKFAICLPDSCTTEDIQEIYPIVQVNSSLCQSKPTQAKFDGGTIAALTFFGIILAIAIVSTAYDIYLYYTETETTHQLLKAFSFLNNGKNLFKVTRSPDQISCLHGIRVISIMWVILGHRFKNLIYVPIANQQDIIQWINKPTSSHILNATLSVDTFLFLSGLMVCYVFFLAMQKGVSFNVPRYYLHRFLRLTPAYYAVILIYMTLLNHLGSGPLWGQVIERYVDKCYDVWWQALLYIQTYASADLCLDHAWYLAVDMQLYLISPILLIILKRWPKLGISFTTLLVFVVIGIDVWCAWYYEYYGWEIFNSTSDYLTNFYYPVYTRAAPWLIGIICGYYIFQIKKNNLKVPIKNKILVLILWIFFIGILMTCIHAGYRKFNDRVYGGLNEVLNVSLLRPSWTVGVAGVTLLCVLGYGGPIDKFLSITPMQILSKLTYCMYLIHRPLQHLHDAVQKEVLFASYYDTFYTFCGDVVFCILAATLLSFLFEGPILTLEKVIFAPPKPKRETKA